MIDAPSPSPYRIPQRCPADRRNARRATIAEKRKLYGLRTDDLVGDPHEGFRLPSYLPILPKEANFTVSKLADLLGHKIQGQLNGLVPNLGVSRIEDYRRYYSLVPRPDTASRWSDDDEFARQRIAGVSPLHLRALDTAPDGLLKGVVDAELDRRGTTIGKVLDAGRLFVADYSALADERVQKYAVKAKRWLAAPKAIYFVGDDDQLHVLGIALPPDRDADEHRAYGPSDDPWAWALAKWHAQCADGSLHEGFYHLFETHMVTELVAVCAARNLHVDHPIAHLLAPHFEFNLAIDCLARTDMLAPGKAIDQALSAGSAGALNAVRILYNGGWKWSERTLAIDCEKRGVADPKRLPFYPYRDYGKGLHAILRDYVEGAMSSFYRNDEDVRGDDELSTWLKETAAHLFGFPGELATRSSLFDVLAELIFRASVQHAAVNNGQFDTYGYVPYAPGAMLAPPPSRKAYTMTEAIKALPRGGDAIAQIGMAWTLSEPTHYGLLGIGDVPAFAPELAPASREAVATVRRRLQTFSDEIAEDNQARKIPYLYLDPRNVERSTGT